MSEQCFNCGKEEAFMILTIFALLGIGLILFLTIRKLFNSWRTKPFLQLQTLFTALDRSTVFNIYAISKREEKKVRIHIEGNYEGEIIGFNLDLEPTAAIELSQSIRVSAHNIGNMEIVNEKAEV